MSSVCESTIDHPEDEAAKNQSLALEDEPEAEPLSVESFHYFQDQPNKCCATVSGLLNPNNHTIDVTDLMMNVLQESFAGNSKSNSEFVSRYKRNKNKSISLIYSYPSH